MNPQRTLIGPLYSTTLFKIPSLSTPDAAFDFPHQTPPEFEAKVYTSDPICIQTLPDSSSLLSGPGLSPPAPNRFRLVVHHRTQSLPVQKVRQQRKSSYHRHSRSLQPGTSPSSGVRIPSFADDPETPSFSFQGRESDIRHLSASQSPLNHDTEELRDSDHSHRPVRPSGAGRLRDLRNSEQSQSVCKEREGAGRRVSISRITPVAAAAQTTSDCRTGTKEQQNIGHRRQRTGVKVGLAKDLIASFESTTSAEKHNTMYKTPGFVQTRIASFENLKSTTEANGHPERPASAPADIPTRKPIATLEPPIVFCPREAGRRAWANPSLREMAQFRMSSLHVDDEEESGDLDLEIRSDELLNMRSRPLPKPRARRPGHTATKSWVGPDNTISRAASIMYEPEELNGYAHGHARAQSVPETSTPASNSRPSSPVRLVPANTHPSMYPSAFRTVMVAEDEIERPSSSHSTTSSSTISDSGPATPKSSTSNAANSWLSWLWSPKGSPAPPPTTEKPQMSMVSVSPCSGAALSPLKAEADDFGFINQKGIKDHWADVNREAGPMSLDGRRSVSRHVRWDDEESVRYSWF